MISKDHVGVRAHGYHLLVSALPAVRTRTSQCAGPAEVMVSERDKPRQLKRRFASVPLCLAKVCRAASSSLQAVNWLNR